MNRNLLFCRAMIRGRVVLLTIIPLLLALKSWQQTPPPPFSYNSDSVEYDNADKTVHLGATLTYPKTGGPFAAAVLITGSGTQDRDETILGHHPFAVIADYLTRRGYAVLRVDDRGAGLSKGDLTKPTSADFAKDVETSMAWLKTQKEIDPSRIGLIGHSEGGMIAPMIASKNKNVAFIISLAGPADGFGTIMYQSVESLKRMHVSDLYITFNTVQERTILSDALSANDTASFLRQVDSQYRVYLLSIPDSAKAKYSFAPTPENFHTLISQQATAVISPWFKFFLAYKAADYYPAVKCPVLLLGGSDDIQVNNAADIPELDSLLKASGNKKVTPHLMPGLNHLFQHCHTCMIQEYGKLEETFSPEVLQIMGDWLDANCGYRSRPSR
jgi:pimeloyl-ACP methyl ester carboxylesterase